MLYDTFGTRMLSDRHVVEENNSELIELQNHVEFLYQVYPKLWIDLLLVQWRISPLLTNKKGFFNVGVSTQYNVCHSITDVCSLRRFGISPSAGHVRWYEGYYEACPEASTCSGLCFWRSDRKQFLMYTPYRDALATLCRSAGYQGRRS